MSFDVGFYIIFFLCFLVSFKADLIKNDAVRKLSYFWFPFLASIALYWIMNWDELFYWDQREHGWAWFAIIQWFIVGLTGSLLALLLKWIFKKRKRQPQNYIQCNKCADLRRIIMIRTPGELTNTIEIVRANLLDKTLRDITQPAHSPSGDFANLSENGPWPDYVEHYFECLECGRRFRLAVDTYYGAGGKWEGKLETY